MKAEETLNTRPRRKIGVRMLQAALVIVIILVVSVVFLLPGFVSSEKGRKVILSKINNSINGRADYVSLSMSWWKGLKITNISFNDNTGQTAVKVKRIATKPHYGSILMGELSFGETIIDEPRVEINLKGQEAKEAKGLQRGELKGLKPQPVVLPIKKIDLVVNDGSLKVTDRQAEVVELSQINSELNLRPPGQQTNFNVSMDITKEGKGSKVTAAGQITPSRQTGWSFEGTSGELTVEVNDLDIGSLGPLFVLTGAGVQAKGNISANIKTGIKNGRVESFNGIVKGRDLDVTAPALKGGRLKSKLLDVGIKFRSEKELLKIEELEIHSDWANAEAAGVMPTTSKSLAELLKPDSVYSLKGSFDCDVAAVLSQIPAVFGLREGINVTSGQLSGSVETFTEVGQKGIRGQVQLVGLAGIVNGKEVALSDSIKAEAQITSDKNGIKFDKVDVSAPFANISCAGTTELLKYKAGVDLAKLQSQLGQFINVGQYQIAGEFFGEGEVSIKKDKIALGGTSVVKDLRISSAEGISAFEPKADLAFSATIERDKGIVNIGFIKADASFGQVSISDAVLPLNKKADIPIKFAVSANNIDLAKLQPFAVLFASFPKEMQLAGMAQSQLSFSFQEGSFRIVTDATKITNLKVNYPQQQPLEQEQVSLVLDAEINPAQKTVAVKKLQLISPQIKIKGNFEKTLEDNQGKLDGKADLEYDWSAASAVAAPFLPAGLKLKGQRKDTVKFSSLYPADQADKLLANLSTKGTLGFAEADYMGLTFGPTEIEVRVQKGQLMILPFSSTVNKGQFSFAAGADFNQKPTLLKTPGPIQIARDIQITEQTSRQLLTYLNPVFANAFNVSGVANFNCERLVIPLAADSQKDIEVIGTVSIEQLRLQASDLLGQILSAVGSDFSGQEITIHPTKFVLQKGFLRYDDMQMDVGDRPINFKGVIGLDKSLDMTVTLPLTSGGKAAKTGEKGVGERVSMALKGTVDKPQIDMGKLLEELAKKRLEEELRKKLEGLFK